MSEIEGSSPLAGRLGARAVERALDDRAREAAAEVERILNAALKVIHRVDPASPRVADILAEAGSSNQAFYRYFAGKDDLILAVMDRGVAILKSYIEHQMAKETDPVAKVERWVTSILAQSNDEQLSRQTRSVGRLVAGIRAPRAFEADSFRTSLMEPLQAALAEAGVSAPQVMADAIHDVAFGALNRHVQGLSPISAAEHDLILRFCIEGSGLQRA